MWSWSVTSELIWESDQKHPVERKKNRSWLKEKRCDENAGSHLGSVWGLHHGNVSRWIPWLWRTPALLRRILLPPKKSRVGSQLRRQMSRGNFIYLFILKYFGINCSEAPWGTGGGSGWEDGWGCGGAGVLNKSLCFRFSQRTRDRSGSVLSPLVLSKKVLCILFLHE